MLAISLAAGTLVALPQIVEFLRVLPGSARALLGYSLESRLAASWNPRMIVDWLTPMPFGRPGRGFWSPATTDGRASLRERSLPPASSFIASGRPVLHRLSQTVVAAIRASVFSAWTVLRNGTASQCQRRLAERDVLQNGCLPR